MKTLQKILAIIAILILVTQTVRHVYLRWLQPRQSVLDKYEQPLKDDIKSAQSLGDLVRKYDEVYKKVQTEKADKSKPSLSYSEKSETEPYKSEIALKEAIRSWESKSKEIHALRFYWFCGLIFLILGAVFYKKFNRWFGLTLMIAAFSEMIYWTSPTFIGPETREFDKLLTYKIIFSLLSFLLLISVVGFERILGNGKEQQLNKTS
jgi:hypothetical protein